MQGTRGQSGCAELQNTPILLVAACCGALLEQAAALGPCMAAATPRCCTPRLGHYRGVHSCAIPLQQNCSVHTKASGSACEPATEPLTSESP